MSKGKKIEFSQEQLNQLLKWYREGKSSNWIAKQFGCSHTVVTRRVKQAGILRTPEESRVIFKTKCNEDYFACVDNEHKAYWLGFLYADGNVTDGPQPSVQLCLTERDSSQVYAFNKALESEYNVGHYNYKNPVCQLRIPSEKLVSDLTRLGCIPRKTLTLKFPTEEQVPEHLIHHFIRGYLDGDGCISGQAIIFLGTREFLEELKRRLPFVHKINVSKQGSKRCHRLSISISHERAQAIYDWLYADATIYLDRKFQKLKLIMD